jgi:hypothetical protein
MAKQDEEEGQEENAGGGARLKRKLRPRTWGGGRCSSPDSGERNADGRKRSDQSLARLGTTRNEALLWIAVQTLRGFRPALCLPCPLQTQDSEDKAVEWRTTTSPSARSYDCSAARRIEPRHHPLPFPYRRRTLWTSRSAGTVAKPPTTSLSDRINSRSVGAKPDANAPFRVKMRRRRLVFSRHRHPPSSPRPAPVCLLFLAALVLLFPVKTCSALVQGQLLERQGE